MEKLLALVAIVLVIIAIGQYMRIYQLTLDISDKREEDISDTDNKFNANMMLLFMLAFFGSFVYLIVEYGSNNFGLGPAATKHGEDIDMLFTLNWSIILFVFFLTQTLLFYFSWRYYYRKDRKAYFYPHNNKLEMVWTLVPSAVLAVIIIMGLTSWNEIMYPGSDEGVTKIEVYSEQFGWTARYAGEDNFLGKADYKLKSPDNLLGVVTKSGIDIRVEQLETTIEQTNQQLEHDILPDWERGELEDRVARMDRLKMRLLDLKETIVEDSIDWDGRASDDVIVNGELHLVVGKEYEFEFRSQDVIHSAYIPHFRLQMNTVPGMKTTFRFTPTITTSAMREIMENEKFDYVLCCNKICGAGHNAMQMKIVVETPDEFKTWIGQQKTISGGAARMPVTLANIEK